MKTKLFTALLLLLFTAPVFSQRVVTFDSHCIIKSEVDTPICFASRFSGYDSYSWDFGDGNHSTDENPCHTYTGSPFQVYDYEVIMTATKTIVTGSFPFATVTFSTPVYDTLYVHIGNFPTPLGYEPEEYNNNGSHVLKICADTIDIVCPEEEVCFSTGLEYHDEYKWVLDIQRDRVGDVASKEETHGEYYRETFYGEQLCYTWHEGNAGYRQSVSFQVTDTCPVVTKRSGFFIVRVPDIPIVNFTSSANSGCAPSLDIQFTNNTIDYLGDSLNLGFGWTCICYPVPTDYLWDFGDGVTSAQSNPVHIYNSWGNYTVTLTATNQCYSNTFSQSINVNLCPPGGPCWYAICDISPNPTKERVRVKYNTGEAQKAELTIDKIDNSFRRTYPLDVKSDQTEVSVADYPVGVYTIGLMTDGKRVDAEKLVIVR